MGHVDEDDDSIGGSEGEDVLLGGPHRDSLVTVTGFRSGNSVENKEELRRKQRDFKIQTAHSQRSNGGFYGDFGFGIGPGFNLHFDGEGTTASVGAGLYGTAKLGYAPDLRRVRAQRMNDRVFGIAEAELGPLKVGMGAEGRYKVVKKGLGFDGVSGSVGPVKAGVDGHWRPYIDLPLELGFEGGFGALKTLPTQAWGKR